MISPVIASLEERLSYAQELEKSDTKSLVESNNSLVDKIFLNSSEKLRSDLEHELYLAKAERAHELISLRLIGNQMTGSIRLRTLVEVFGPFNSLLEYSALEEGLRNIFGLLTAKNENFVGQVNDIGVKGIKALSTLMGLMEKRNIAVELFWNGPEKNHVWDGRPDEITRIKAILDDLGEPEVITETFIGLIQVLSIRNRIEVYRQDTEEKLTLSYNRSLVDDVNELHLGDRREFVVEKTRYPLRISQKKKDAYTLKEINYMKV